MLLNEAYYGKDRLLLDCERQIAILKKETSVISEDKNSHAANKKLQTLLAKKFNVEKVIITWIPSLTVNGFTHPITFMLDVTKEDIKVKRDGKDGIKFQNAKGKIMTISIYEGLTYELTEGEILSIILHEIGHNFFVLQHTFILSKIDFILNLLQMMIEELKKTGVPLNTIKELLIYCFYYVKPGRQLQAAIADGLNQNEMFRGIHNLNKVISIIASFMGRLIIDAVQLTMIPVSLLYSVVGGIASTPIFFIRELMSAGYANEKFSDNFATSYGYGPELASSQEKMSNYAKSTNLYIKPLADTPVGFIYNIVYSLIMFFVHLGDPHPQTMARVTDQVRLLEAELNKPEIPKHQKDIIRKDLQKIKQVQQRMQDVSNLVGVEFMNGFVQSCFGGDPKEVFLRTNDYDARDNKVFGWREDIELDYFMEI